MQTPYSQTHLVSSGYAIGIDIGGTSTKIARVTPRGDVLDVCTIPTEGSRGSDSFICSIAVETFRSLCGSAYAQHVDILAAKLGWQAVLAGAAIPILQIGKEGILHSI